MSRAPADRAARWPVNFALAFLNGLVASLAPALAVAAARWAETRQFGLLHWAACPPPAGFAISLILASLAAYALHWASHANPLLWRFHRVHHSDVFFDATTTLRHHPVEMIAAILLLTPVYALGGLSPAAIAFYLMAEELFGVATHANIRLPERYEWRLALVFVTPSLHRLHHSNVRAETDSNYGDVFSFWDRLFRTFLAAPPNRRALVVAGLEDVDKRRAEDFWELLKLPWRAPA